VRAVNIVLADVAPDCVVGVEFEGPAPLELEGCTEGSPATTRHGSSMLAWNPSYPSERSFDRRRCSSIHAALCLACWRSPAQIE
jgi:hypothetical protein